MAKIKDKNLNLDSSTNYPEPFEWFVKSQDIEEGYISPISPPSLKEESENTFSKPKLKNPESANPEKIRFPTSLKKLISCPAAVMYKQIGSQKFIAGKDKFTAKAFLGIDKRKRLFFQVGLFIPGRTYVLLTISKFYLLEILKYHLKLKPIYPQDTSKLWFHHEEITKAIQTEDLDSIDPDRILEDYLAAVTNMENVVKHPCNHHKEQSHQQLQHLLSLEDRIKTWAYVQACKNEDLIPDPMELKELGFKAKTIRGFRFSLRDIKGL
jgi:hypothetical protein